MSLGSNTRHREFLRFVSRLTSVAAGISKEDLDEFARVARRDFPWLERIIHGYLDLAIRADSDVVRHSVGRRRTSAPENFDPRHMHLFDLLRSKQLFPSNADLANFAGRILPNMTRRRFDKMSRGDIAARIIEYLETLDSSTRNRLEDAVRTAAARSHSSGTATSDTFFQRWESIIKGLEL